MSYAELLRRSADAAGSLLCIGIDPVVEWFPREVRDAAIAAGDHAILGISTILDAALDSLEATGIRPAAFKPNIGYFTRYDRPLHEAGDSCRRRFPGSTALADVMSTIRRRMPGVPIILDAKRGDIARSSENYAIEAFDVWNADAVTVSPWMGDDSVSPFLDAAANRGVYVLARTSNPGARRFQNLTVASDTAPKTGPLYRTVTQTIAEWAESAPGAGLVAGATAPGELAKILSALASHPLPVLIPGIGRQGGSAAAVLQILGEANYPAHLVRINASSGALFPWAAEESGAPARWRDAISTALTTLHRSMVIPPSPGGRP